MMEHPAEQTLLAYLDRELPFDERSTVREHVQVCVECSRMLDELAAATRSFADAISALDVPAPALLAPIPAAATITPLRRRRASRRPLLAAALIIIFVAGAGAAIPGSPLREWLARSVELVTGGPSEEPSDPTTPVSGQRAGSPAAVSVRPLDGLVRIIITQPAPETTIRVRLLDGGTASVWSVEGRYRTAPGEIEVLGAGPGEVVILLPRTVPSAEVELDGRLVATKEGSDFRLLIPAADSSDAEVSFQVGG
ncbi:MAG: zf-HC2 domain-containing protein [Gemmatimonadota bacterium]